jgi:hypothetical protein
MKWFVFIAIIAAGYYFVMTQTADLMLSQTQKLQQQYTYVAKNADAIAAGTMPVNNPQNR